MTPITQSFVNIRNTLKDKIDKAPTTDLNMNKSKIINLKNGENESEAINLKQMKDYVNNSHISSSNNKKDVFRYLMEDIDESSSEQNITVTGIEPYSKSPHTYNKQAYKIQLQKNEDNKYRPRIGFNMYKLPQGEYTFVVEYFPFDISLDTTISVVSASLNVGQQSYKKFTTLDYVKAIVHVHK